MLYYLLKIVEASVESLTRNHTEIKKSKHVNTVHNNDKITNKKPVYIGDNKPYHGECDRLLEKKSSLAENSSSDGSVKTPKLVMFEKKGENKNYIKSDKKSESKPILHQTKKNVNHLIENKIANMDSKDQMNRFRELMKHAREADYHFENIKKFKEEMIELRKKSKKDKIEVGSTSNDSGSDTDVTTSRPNPDTDVQLDIDMLSENEENYDSLDMKDYEETTDGECQKTFLKKMFKSVYGLEGENTDLFASYFEKNGILYEDDTNDTYSGPTKSKLQEIFLEIEGIKESVDDMLKLPDISDPNVTQ